MKTVDGQSLGFSPLFFSFLFSRLESRLAMDNRNTPDRHIWVVLYQDE